MTTSPKKGIPVHSLPPGTLLAETESELREYERRYEMSSDRMAELLELDAIRPTAEVLKWYAAYQGAKLLRERTRTTGTHGTTTAPSMRPD